MQLFASSKNMILTKIMIWCPAFHKIDIDIIVTLCVITGIVIRIMLAYHNLEIAFKRMLRFLSFFIPAGGEIWAIWLQKYNKRINRIKKWRRGFDASSATNESSSSYFRMYFQNMLGKHLYCFWFPSARPSILNVSKIKHFFWTCGDIWTLPLCTQAWPYDHETFVHLKGTLYLVHTEILDPRILVCTVGLDFLFSGGIINNY